MDNLQTRATVQQTIWDFGRTRERRDQARLGMEMADQSHQDHMRQIMLAVIDGYYSTSLAQASLATARLALRSAEAIENQAKARVESGLAVEADLLRESYVSFGSKAAGDTRARSIGKRASLPQSSYGKSAQPCDRRNRAFSGCKYSLPSEESLVSEQKRQRPDYQNLLAELHQAEIAVRSRQKEFLPIITGYSAWEMDNPSLSDYGGNNWAAGITLRWNLFAGGGDAAQRDAALQRLEQKRRQVAAQESAMALEIRRAIIQYRTAEQQVKAAQAAEAQSEEGLRILKNAL